MLPPQGVLPDPDHVQKIKMWPVPSCVTDVWALLGMGNYTGILSTLFKENAAPDWLKKDKAFEWTEECQYAFDQLKEALTGPDIMAYLMGEGEVILDTDASLDTVGEVLSQVQDCAECVIAYGIRTLSKQEGNYCVTDCDVLVIHFFTE